jgi:hypothetical protein
MPEKQSLKANARNIVNSSVEILKLLACKLEVGVFVGLINDAFLLGYVIMNGKSVNRSRRPCNMLRHYHFVCL